MPKLLVRAALADFDEAQALEDGDHLPRLQDGQSAHRSADDHLLHADELRLDLRLALLQQQADHFA